MTDTEKLEITLDAGAARSQDRRRFLRQASTVAVVAGAGSLLAACGGGGNDATPTPTPTGTASPTPSSSASASLSDPDILNFLLNLKYLEAQFFAFAATGAAIPAASIAAGSAGTGALGTVTGGAQVAFADPLVAQYAREIAADQLAHVNYLRSLIGTITVPMPSINIAGGAGGAFNTIALAAGVISAGQTFNPYADDNSFLLSAFIFSDLAVTAYKGASVLFASKLFLESVAGIAAAEAYHGGLLRTVLYNKGLYAQAQGISDWRDSLDGGSDLDQGIGTAAQANITPADGDAIAFSRSSGQLLNVLYGTRNAVVGGLFFPNGTNGMIRSSAAS